MLSEQSEEFLGMVYACLCSGGAGAEGGGKGVAPITQSDGEKGPRQNCNALDSFGHADLINVCICM